MVSLDTTSLTRLHWVGVVLAAITGVIHLVLGIQFVMQQVTPLSVGFVIAGLGFFVGIAAILTNTRRREMYLVGIPFTAGQIVIYTATVLFAGNPIGPGAIVDKLAQVAFIVVLVLLLQRE